MRNAIGNALAGIGTGLLCSCATLQTIGVQSRDPTPQASDPVTATGGLAMTAFRATVVATVRQPVTTVKTGLAVMWHRPRELVTGSVLVPMMPAGEVGAERPGSKAFDERLDREGIGAAESGRLKYFVDGGPFFKEFDKQVAEAESSIDLQVFIFDNDDIAVRSADQLRARSSAVKVRVLYDDLGSSFAATSPPETPAPEGFTPPADIGRYLRADSAVKVRRTLNPWLTADHTKVMVFDRRMAMMGGMNLGREYYSEWHDLMVGIEGPVVGILSREFEEAWTRAGPAGDFALPPRRRPPPPAVAGGVPLRVLRTDPGEGRHEVRDAMLLAIRGSRERVWIQNPYFASDEIVRVVAAAAERGVDVSVILPSKNDSRIMDIGNLGTARRLIDSGAKVYLYPGMSHLKAMICDGWATVGSANLDLLSMRINRELNLAYSDLETVKGLERAVFLPDFRKSKRLKREDTETPLAPLVKVIVDQL